MKLSFGKPKWYPKVRDEFLKLCKSSGGLGIEVLTKWQGNPAVILACYGVPEYSSDVEEKIKEFIKRTDEEIGKILSKDRGTLDMEFHFNKGEINRIKYWAANDGDRREDKLKYLLMEARGRPTFIPPGCGIFKSGEPSLFCEKRWASPEEGLGNAFDELEEKIRAAMS
jgi:hypothetical protein